MADPQPTPQTSPSASARPADAGPLPHGDWSKPLDADEKAAHLVNRITFGARPGDFDRVRAMGLKLFTAQQLHPERLDDSQVEARLASLPTLEMTTGELIEKYPAPNPAQKQQERLAPPKVNLRDAAAQAMRVGNPGVMSDAAPMNQATDAPHEVLVELGREELLRAVYSNRQLQELMVQLWMNHFNIFAAKGPDKWMLTSFERDVIRPRVLGKFEDLLLATAQSPAMLFYLDNWLSAAPDSAPFGALEGRPASFAGRARPFAGGFAVPSPQAAIPANRPKRGLNENYGRELMELHTLGVNGGYSQQDVIEVARCLTGWTLRRPRLGPEFFFNPRMHDFGPKTVLGHSIPAGQGMEDGLEVLHILAAHPSTAHFISLKLCRRFVADDPPAFLVDRASRKFLASDGDLRAVLEIILSSPEFYSRAAYRAKVKSPIEMVASTLRAFDAQTDAGPQLLNMIGRMGEPLFFYQAPAGFPDRAGTWISSSTLLARLNFAELAASNRIKRTEIDWAGAAAAEDQGSSEETLDGLSRRLMGTGLSEASRQAILSSMNDQAQPAERTASTSTLAALLVGSPEFQRR